MVSCADYDQERHQHGVRQAAIHVLQFRDLLIVFRVRGDILYRRAEAHVLERFILRILWIDEASHGGLPHFDHGDDLAVDFHVPQLLFFAVHRDSLLIVRAACGRDVGQLALVGLLRFARFGVNAHADAAFHQRVFLILPVYFDVVQRQRFGLAGDGRGHVLAREQPRRIDERILRLFQRGGQHVDERKQHEQRQADEHGIDQDGPDETNAAIGFGFHLNLPFIRAAA